MDHQQKTDLLSKALLQNLRTKEIVAGAKQIADLEPQTIRDVVNSDPSMIISVITSLSETIEIMQNLINKLIEDKMENS